MKTFTFESKVFMRILLLCMIACFSLTQARADYYYRVKLADKDGNIIKLTDVPDDYFNKDGKFEWSGRIHVNQGSGLINALNKLIGGATEVQTKDENGKLKFEYKKSENETIYVFYSEDDLKDENLSKNNLRKDDKGNYHITVGGNEYALESVRHTEKRLGTTIHDEDGNEISLKYTDGDGKLMDNVEYVNYYDTKEHKYDIVGFAIGKGSDQGSILQFSDYEAFKKIKAYIKELDLHFWNKATANGSFYMANMSKLKKLVMPANDFAIGGEKMFAGATELEEIVFTSRTEGGNTTETNITFIGDGAFKHGNKIPGAIIQKMINQAAEYAKTHNPEGDFHYGTIGKEAFYECYKIGEIEIPEGIKAIGSEAFRMTKNPSDFTTLILSTNNNLEIGHSAFRGCENLKDVNINDGTKITKLGEAAFSDSRSLSNASVKAILENYGTYSRETVNVNGSEVKFVPAHLFFGVQGRGDKNPLATLNFTELTIPADFGAIGEGAFGHTESDIQVLNKITVSGSVAPKCRVPVGVINELQGYKDVFQGINPNYVTVTFTGAADGYASDGKTGYKTYRAEDDFMRLMTKTLDENKEKYDVYPQMYADVKLKRSFKAGWNTLALPFGSPSDEKKDVDCAEIYTNALGATDIAVYRGLRKNQDVFTFLHYASVDKDPLDEFEPILVNMPESAIGKEYYTFKNVDLNYDADNKELYAPANLPGCVNSDNKQFNGEYDTTGMPLFSGNDYNTYYFDGTFKMFKDENHEKIKPGDYIIQNGKFVLCNGEKKYAMKGFRGYFKKSDNAQFAASEAINIAVYNTDGTVTDIVRINADGEADNATHDIYNIMGQKVRSNTNSTEGLKSGIYIVNGKKVLVK